MTLHQVLNRDVQWLWRWYDATVARQGRAHLLKVPVVKSGASPYTYTPGEVYWPNRYIQKYCNTTQRATSYLPHYWWEYWREWGGDRRGICTVCYAAGLAMTREQIEGRNFSYGTERRAVALTNDESLEEWIQDRRSGHAW